MPEKMGHTVEEVAQAKEHHFDAGRVYVAAWRDNDSSVYCWCCGRCQPCRALTGVGAAPRPGSSARIDLDDFCCT